ncbi:MAG: proton-conducting transporter membrane subunit, partial [Burkholderiales bacterium]
FHFWIPDVYKQISFKIVAYLATVPKLAAISLLARIWKVYILPTHPYSRTLQDLLILAALLTLLIGHIAALRQKHPRDILIYGSIAQGGWLLTGILVSTIHAPVLSYYGCIYGIMTIAAWHGLQCLQVSSLHPTVTDYQGMGWKEPWISIGWMIALLALIGLPPTAGFTAKFFILTGLWNQAQVMKSNLLETLWLASLLGSLLAVYYYLKIPYILFFKAGKQSTAHAFTPSYFQYFIFLVLLLLLIGIFFLGNRVMDVFPHLLDS